MFERITLGLYREPASAIRELISNAYDADATTVTIDMNAPLFDRIVVKDDGNGMSAEVVDYLVHHVGGSLKRTQQGFTPALSPKLEKAQAAVASSGRWGWPVLRRAADVSFHCGDQAQGRHAPFRSRHRAKRSRCSQAR